MKGNTVIIARELNLYKEGQMRWPLSRSTYCVINHLLTGLMAARSLARIPSDEAITPIRLLLLREDIFTTTTEILTCWHEPALFMKVRCESMQTRRETGARRRKALRHTRTVCRSAERRDCLSQQRIRACSRRFMNNAG